MMKLHDHTKIYPLFLHLQLLLLLLLLLLHLAAPALAQLGLDISAGGRGGLTVWINGPAGTVSIDAGGQAALPPPPSRNGVPNDDYAALQAWKRAITDDPAGILASWVGPNVCSYRGIYCSSLPTAPSSSSSSPAISVVAGIDLNRANLKGVLVTELSLLSHLTFLHLNANRFSGTLPDSFSHLQYLTELDLSSNLFSGPFPAVVLAMPRLLYLDLRFNSLTGQVPEELFAPAKALDAIFLNNNQFQGQIPMSIWSSSASVITLANNRFSGSIPINYAVGGFSGGSRIKEVLLLNNKLTGCIPEELGFMESLEVLDVSFNTLTGNLPSSLSCLAGVEVLNLAHNQLTGELPDMVCELKKLSNLSVSFNFFSGFGQECAVRGSYAGGGGAAGGFDFTGNCIPGSNMQRPQPECGMGEGGDNSGAAMSCFRIPAVRPVACAMGSIGSGGGGGVKVQGAAPFNKNMQNDVADGSTSPPWP